MLNACQVLLIPFYLSVEKVEFVTDEVSAIHWLYVDSQLDEFNDSQCSLNRKMKALYVIFLLLTSFSAKFHEIIES